ARGPAGPGAGGTGRGLRATRLSPVRGRRLAIGPAAPRPSAVAPVRRLARPVRRRRTRSPRRPRHAGSPARTQLGRAQHRRHLPSPGRRHPAGPAAAVHAARPPARRFDDAAGAGTGLRRLPSHGRRAGPRSGGRDAHARRPERPSAVALLGRRTRRLGPGPAVAVPARPGDPHAPAPAPAALNRPRHAAFIASLLASPCPAPADARQPDDLPPLLYPFPSTISRQSAPRRRATHD